MTPVAWSGVKLGPPATDATTSVPIDNARVRDDSSVADSTYWPEGGGTGGR